MGRERRSRSRGNAGAGACGTFSIREPARLRFIDAAGELRDAVGHHAVVAPAGAVRIAKPAPRLARRAADDPVELACWRMERLRMSPPHSKVGTAHDAKAFFLERLVEKADAGEKGQN
jgi:hypothetical protein